MVTWTIFKNHLLEVGLIQNRETMAFRTLTTIGPHYMILEVCWDGLWTLSFGLSQFHGHSSWLMCEVALSYTRMLADAKLLQIPRIVSNVRRGTFDT
jgi:hypothetical protein